MKWRNNSELLSSSGEQPELLFLVVEQIRVVLSIPLYVASTMVFNKCKGRFSSVFLIDEGLQSPGF